MREEQRQKILSQYTQLSIPSVQINAANPLLVEKTDSWVAQRFGLKRDKRLEGSKRREKDVGTRGRIYDMRVLESQEHVEMVIAFLEEQKIPHRFLDERITAKMKGKAD